MGQSWGSAFVDGELREPRNSYRREAGILAVIRPSQRAEPERLDGDYRLRLSIMLFFGGFHSILLLRFVVACLADIPRLRREFNSLLDSQLICEVGCFEAFESIHFIPMFAMKLLFILPLCCACGENGQI